MKCKSCDATATMRMFWPGQATEVCDYHAARMRDLASAMGFECSGQALEKISEPRSSSKPEKKNS